jgi:hypothetical protein
MSKITITSITFNPVPTKATGVQFKYRPKTVDDSADWIPLNNSAVISVPISGVLTTPLVIPNLDPVTEYELFVQADCGTEPYTIVVTTPTLSCPSIEAIETQLTN